MAKTNQQFLPAHEMEGVRNRAIKRAENKVEEREHLRLEIQSRKLIQEMQTAAFLLYTGVDAKEDSDEPSGVRFIPLTRDRIAGLKAAADISDKLLKKVLPDLKQMEINDGGPGGEGRILENIELNNRMRLYMQAIKERVQPQENTDDIEEGVIVESNLDFLS